MKRMFARYFGGVGASLAAVAFAVGVGSVPASPVQAQETASEQDADDIAMRFGIRSSVLQISLSPDGTKVAWIAPGPNHTEILKMFDLEGTGGIESVASNTEITADLSSCHWVTNERLLCEVFGMSQRREDGVLLPYSRMFAINYDGSEMERLTDTRDRRALRFNQNGGDIVAFDIPGGEGQVLITRNYEEQSAFMTRMASHKVGLGVDRLDVSDMSREVEVQPDEYSTRYLADETGEVRLRQRSLRDVQGLLTGERVFLVRSRDERRWTELENVTLNGAPIDDFYPVSVSAERNSIYAYETINGFDAVIEIPLDGEHAATVVASRDDVDVARLIRIGRQQRVVGVSWATEKISVDYFDASLARLASGMGRALPNQPLINIVGASADENRLLLVASSDTDPGVVYLYDKTTRQLEPLLQMREYLVDQPMGEMQPVTFPASDGTQIPGYLTLPPGSDGKNLPAVVLPHGGPASRDFWGFDWIVQFFTARGYAVLQPNFRGSSGYGEAWFGRNGFQAWEVAVGDVNDAGRWLVSQGIANADQLAIVGWSYGGYAALQSQVMDPDLYKAVVAIAPVTDLEFLREDARAYTSFNLRDEQLGQGPHIAAGSPRRHADMFRAPVALFHGTRDINVDVRQSQSMADALEDAGKPVTYVEFEDLQHDLDDSRARVQMLRTIDGFLNEALGR